MGHLLSNVPWSDQSVLSDGGPWWVETSFPLRGIFRRPYGRPTARASVAPSENNVHWNHWAWIWRCLFSICVEESRRLGPTAARRNPKPERIPDKNWPVHWPKTARNKLHEWGPSNLEANPGWNDIASSIENCSIGFPNELSEKSNKANLSLRSLEDLKILEFKFAIENDQIIIQNHYIRIITIENLLNNTNIYNIRNHRIIFYGIENIKKDLKNYIRISLTKKHWFNSLNQCSPLNQKIITTYNLLNEKFFLNKFLGKSYIFLDQEDVKFFSDFFNENSCFSNRFLRVSNALSKGWACWVELDNKNLEWNFYLEPVSYTHLTLPTNREV